MARPIGAKDGIKRSHKYSFARQYLADWGTKVYCGQEQILAPVEHLYDIKLPVTRYLVGDRLVDKGITKKISSFESLRNMGFLVESKKIRPKDRWIKSQHKVYLIIRADEADDDAIKRFPLDHYAEYDAYNKTIRLWGKNAGPNGYGPWIRIEKENKGIRDGQGRPITNKGYIENSEELIDKQLRSWIGVDEAPQPINIEECAFMVTESNEIVCIPHKINDMPTIGIFGMRGSGKSYTQHSIISRLFWKPKFKYKIIVLNDSSRETGTWCLPNSDIDQLMTLKRLNEKRLPLPCVYLHPLMSRDYEKLHMNNVGFDVSIPFKEIIDNYKEYINFGRSAKYFIKMKNDLANCSTQEEALSFLDTIGVAFGVTQNSADKIRAEFDMIFDTGITDISWEHQAPWGTSKIPDKSYNPITACVHAGVIPILVTENVSTEDPELLSIYFTYFVKDLFRRQKQDPEFEKKKTEFLLVIDEAHNISSGEKVRSEADRLLRRCVREGRPRRIGTIITSQNFMELPKIIKGNTTYLICFKAPGEANEIASQYNMGRAVADMIKDLGKHECIAYTTEYFIVYDSNGNRRRSELNEVFKGRSLPPYSEHKKPKSKGK